MLTKFQDLATDWSEGEGRRSSRSRTFRALTMCEKCYTYYYKNSWHFERPDNFPSEHDGAAVSVHFTRCAACLEQEEALCAEELNPISSGKVMEWEHSGVSSASFSR